MRASFVAWVVLASCLGGVLPVEAAPVATATNTLIDAHATMNDAPVTVLTPGLDTGAWSARIDIQPREASIIIHPLGAGGRDITLFSANPRQARVNASPYPLLAAPCGVRVGAVASVAECGMSSDASWDVNAEVPGVARTSRGNSIPVLPGADDASMSVPLDWSTGTASLWDGYDAWRSNSTGAWSSPVLALLPEDEVVQNATPTVYMGFVSYPDIDVGVRVSEVSAIEASSTPRPAVAGPAMDMAAPALVAGSRSNPFLSALSAHNQAPPSDGLNAQGVAGPVAAVPASTGPGERPPWGLRPAAQAAIAAGALGLLALSASVLWSLRSHDEGAADQETRRKILECVTASPGIHVAGLAKHLELTEQTVTYHVRRMLRSAVLIQEAAPGSERAAFFATGCQMTKHERALAVILRHPLRSRMLEIIRTRAGTVGAGDIALALDANPRAIEYQLARLRTQGVIVTVHTREVSHALAIAPEWRACAALLADRVSAAPAAAMLAHAGHESVSPASDSFGI